MHTICLREPWESIQTAAGTIHIRRFHRPTGLEAGEQVYLTITESQGVQAVRLNGELLKQDPPHSGRYPITAHLLPRNELALELAPGGQRGEVCLQILNPKS